MASAVRGPRPAALAAVAVAASGTQERWVASWALGHFLLDPEPKPDLRARFHRCLVRTIRDGVGASTSAFDTVIGIPIEPVQKAM